MTATVRADTAPVTAPEPSAVLARAAELAQRFAQNAALHDAERSLPIENLQPLFDAGLLSLVIARTRGGSGGGLEAATEAVSTIASGDPSTALVLAMHYIQHGQLAFGEDQWPEELTSLLVRQSLEGVALVNAAYVEPFLGSASHGAIPQTSAKLVDGQWHLNGHKKYVTGARGLSWIRVMGVTEEPEPRVGFFLVPARAEGVEVVPTWDTVGMRATDSNDVIFRDVVLPQSHFFGGSPVAQGLKMSPLDGVWYLLLLSAVYHGVAIAARNAIVDFATGFAPGSLGAPLASLPRFQDAIGDIEITLAASQRLIRSIGRDYDAGHAKQPHRLADLARDAGVTKQVVIENSIRITSVALELAGNQGITRTNPFERFHRDVISARAHNPQAHLTRSRLGQAALSVETRTPLWNGTRT
ncbi:acyl-CoA dehydrogenase family protein [Tsuneonella sp. CC-YZS046]|uniref:acyl-CoA dehydrogenase family protein n=1 Tax=Tsuneonella sp. CC-YZS046 TaxID=3042152 RepID=UPI002D7933EF|nr:acyl-CoA dehydrogenase family protein [Tsuneonella sp. CC-YZS046]WRO66630.1 acyl-CoA dehydrogenase family protein [Tsuneonella sp. CC-YZS046]